jgi:Tfp pilus assembly protein PilF
MSKIVSIVGLGLIVAAGALTVASTNYETQQKANKELCKTYITNAKEALKSGDKDKANNFAKKAFKVDSQNNAIFELLKEINGANKETSSQNSEKPKPKRRAMPDLGC